MKSILGPQLPLPYRLLSRLHTIILRTKSRPFAQQLLISVQIRTHHITMVISVTAPPHRRRHAHLLLI